MSGARRVAIKTALGRRLLSQRAPLPPRVQVSGDSFAESRKVARARRASARAGRRDKLRGVEARARK